MTGAALLGVGMLVAGGVTTLQDNMIAGTAMAVTHRASRVVGPHLGIIGSTSNPPPKGEHPVASIANPPPVQSGAQPVGTIRLPHGGIARLVHSAVSADGALAIPDGVREASWWGAGFGATSGATVVAGHINWNGAVGPFDELWRATGGDKVTVIDNSGHAYTYRISQVITVSKDALGKRAPQLFAQDGPPRLVLVTCGGAWIGGATGYASNQVVIATPE